MKRSISCFVALCLLFGTASLVGCPAPSDGGATATTTTSAAGGEPSAPSEPEFLDAVGEQDFGGAEMVISCFERYRYEVYAEEDSRDALDQLIFKRTEKLEERFHAKIVPDVTNMTGETDHGSHIEYLRTELAGMAPSFDMIAMYAYVSERTQLGKHLRNLRTAVPFVRESIAGESPWWPKIINAGSTVMGRQYVGVTDFSITAIDMAMAILFNETLFSSYNVLAEYNAEEDTEYGSIYDLVDAGAWTLDTMTAMLKDRWYDHAEVGVAGQADPEDVIGLFTDQTSHVDSFTAALGFRFVENDGISKPTLWTMPATYETAIGKLRSLLLDSDGAIMNGTRTFYNVPAADHTRLFAEGHAIMAASTLLALKNPLIKGMEQNYGVLPYPKLDADQPRYLTGSGGSMTVIAVPKYTTGKDLRLTGAMIEGLSAETYKSVTDVYYGMILKHDSGFVDRRSLDMLDKIMEGRTYALSSYHCSEFIFNTWETYAEFSIFTRYLLTYPNKDVAGAWSGIRDFCKTALDKIIAIYESENV